MRKIGVNGLPAILTAVFFIASAHAQEWEMPRTEFGDPDLQGVWSNATQTKLENHARETGKSRVTARAIQIVLRRPMAILLPVTIRSGSIAVTALFKSMASIGHQ